MNVLKYRVSLDMFDTHSQTTIKAKKCDSACEIHITLTEKGKIYNIGEKCSATFNAKKTDGNFIYDKCTIEGNTIVYNFASSIDEDGNAQISACEGIVECEVTLYNATGERLTSPRFTLFIDGTVYNGEDVISTPQADVFKELIKEAEDIVEEMEEKAKTIDGKENKDNKITSLDDPSKLTDEQYPSAKATFNAVASVSHGAYDQVEQLRSDMFGYLSDKADKSQIGEIETALDNKVNKEEGKTLYRGMELIYEYTYTDKSAGTTFSVTLDTNNEPFKLEEFVMRITIPATETDNTVSKVFTVFANAQSGSSHRICYLNTGTVKERKLCMVEGKRAKKGFWYGGTIGFAKGLHETDWRGLYNMESVDYITAFNNLSIGSASISGTKVEIYGRKVDL
jgi:hypothetical protein